MSEPGGAPVLHVSCSGPHRRVHGVRQLITGSQSGEIGCAPDISTTGGITCVDRAARALGRHERGSHRTDGRCGRKWLSRKVGQRIEARRGARKPVGCTLNMSECKSQ